ncbi:DUF1800 domain-containing protein [bacterium]|nr:MAG: DUF1800 domain-containing protein [bacterium]
MTRRELIAAGAAAGLVAGCAPIASRLTPARTAVKGLEDPARRTLDRIAYGPSSEDLSAIRSQGREAWIDSQLSKEADEPAHLVLRLRPLDALHGDAYELRDLPEDTMLNQLQQAAILRAVYSPNGLRERMVEVWTDWFCVFGRKGHAAYRLGPEQNAVVRPHALGRFEELVSASAHSPAMLAFLDNPFNSQATPNENYARELMELHTLGVDGGYTQQDVREVARCFSGWGLERGFLRHKGAFKFDPDRHDNGEKVVLGERIPAGGGEGDGQRVLAMLAHHPATAQRVSRRLCRRFLGNPEAKAAAKAERVFTETKGDLRATLEPILKSKELVEGPPIFSRPFDFLTATIRKAGGETDGGGGIQSALRTMGQPLYEWPMPDGYPDSDMAWTGTMLARWNYVLDLTADRIGGTSVPKDTDRLALLSPEAMWR